MEEAIKEINSNILDLLGGLGSLRAHISNNKITI